jgi:hypothetical protein
MQLQSAWRDDRRSWRQRRSMGAEHSAHVVPVEYHDVSRRKADGHKLTTIASEA